VWDAAGDKFYETGVDRGVLYLSDSNGNYDNGYAWNGLTTVTESPTGAEATPTYADNIVYANLISVERWAGTIEAYTYPDEFAECDGSNEAQVGVFVGQQPRRKFGFAYRTIKGNDVEGNELGYKLHLVYGATAAPSEKAYATVNDSPEMITFSWELTTVPVAVSGMKPTASITIDSTKVDSAALAALELILYGSVGVDPALPLPDAVLTLFDGTFTGVTPTAPTYNSTTDDITIPSVTGVEYLIDGEVVTGTVHITANTVVTARPTAGYYFLAGSDDDWSIVFS
jgi:hypothetical protein